jgi:ABC-2 type transport system permease protein
LGDLALGLGILIVGAKLGPIDWDLGRVVFTACAVLGGGLVEAGVQVFLSGLAFAMRSTYTIKVSVDNVFTDFGAYPLPIFGQAGTITLTLAPPLAFIAYLPCTVLLGRTSELMLPGWIASVSPLAGPILIAVGYVFFTVQSRVYDSPGS